LAEESHGQATDAAWEPDCVSRAISGEPAAFELLVDAYTPRIYSHAIRMLRNREEAEDIVQETFLRVYRNLSAFDQKRPFRNWVYTIATNLALNALRARQRRGQPVALDFGDVDANWVANATARDVVTREDLAERIANAVCKLPAQPAALVHLHYIEGMTIREAAEMLNMREDAAKVALHRARKRLRELLQNEP